MPPVPLKNTIIATALPAQVGDRFQSMNTPEDTCEAKVVMKSGQIGAQITASFDPPGMPGLTSTLFIAAEPIKKSKREQQ